MLRICKYCGREYRGDPGSSACPECVAAGRRTTIRPRVCRQCGATFPGGPRAWYCPDCRRERKLVRDREHQRNKSKRPIGSVDRCVICGGEYIVASGAQKYCPDCAPEATREAIRAQSRKWAAENNTPEERMAVRKKAAAPIPCEVCGKLFVPTTAILTCSPECAAERHKRHAAQWERTHKEHRSEYRRNRRKKS